MPINVLLLDGSPLRRSFLSEMLRGCRVAQCDQLNEAMDSIANGHPVDIAVVQYRRNVAALVRCLRIRQPNIKVIAFGVPRAIPAGVDRYLVEPVMGFELLHLIEELGRQRSAPRRHGQLRALRATAA